MARLEPDSQPSQRVLVKIIIGRPPLAFAGRFEFSHEYFQQLAVTSATHSTPARI